MSDTPGNDIANLAAFIPDFAERNPHKPAILYPKPWDGEGSVEYDQLTFRELDEQIRMYARGFVKIGVTPGMRVSFMVTPGIEFLPLAFALFRMGAVPILIDPGMGKENLLNCVKVSVPEAFVGVAKAQAAKLLYRQYFKSVKIKVTIGSNFVWGGNSLKDLEVKEGETPEITTVTDDPAAIIFTSGSTGPPKGVVYTHGMFCAQRQALMDTYDIVEDDIDMPGFALFSLFTLAMGCTVIFPDMDQTAPIDVEPENIIAAVNQNKVTMSFGSPALWETVSVFCMEQNQKLPSLKKVFMAGAPVSAGLHVRMLGKVLTEGGDVYTPYGATESLPVTSFQGSLMLEETCELTARGKGYCVGEPLPGVTLRVIQISDGLIPNIYYANEMPQGQIGEVIVQGPNVSPAYFRMPQHDEMHKIYETEDIDGPFWHRIGDLGYIDHHGRLWLCGRRSQRVETGGKTHNVSLWGSRPVQVRIPGKTLYTACCEAIFNDHPDVYRSALVGVGQTMENQLPVIVIEPTGEEMPSEDKLENLRGILLRLAEKYDETKLIETILFHDDLPVDVRHNAKIFREKLSVWASGELAE